MISIIVAAGESKRFIDAGYQDSKPLLPMPDDRPLLSWIRDRLPRGRHILVARERDKEDLLPWTHEMYHSWVERPTYGPFASLLYAAPYLGPYADTDDVFITYCDTFTMERRITQDFVTAARESGADTAMVVFKSTDPRYGYWDGAKVVEKQVISPWAVSGIFWLKRWGIRGEWRSKIDESISHAPQGAGVPYLMDANTFCYEVSNLVDVGVPADYERFISEQGRHE